jgi:N4-gp56 family major capsid protein
MANADTAFGANSALQKRVYAAELWEAGRDQNFFFSKNFIGKNDSDMNSPIHKITKLSKTERGLECVMPLVQDAQEDGTVGDNKLEDNEEQLTADAITIRYDQLRHGFRSRGEMAEMETVIVFRSVAKNRLAFWIADKIDELMFLTLAGRSYSLNTNGTARAAGSQLPQLSFAADVAAATSGRILYAGSATSEATLTANDKMSWSVIVNAKAMAQRKKVRPIRDGGREYYILVMSTEQMRDLRLDPTFQTILKGAQERGSKNPLFTAADVTVEGVVLYSHNKVFNTLGLSSGSRWGSGGTVHGAQAQLLGAQAAGIAIVENTFYREQKKDYDNRVGIATGRKIGMLKPQVRSIPDGLSKQDFGTIAVKTAAGATA